ncbi:photosynthetic NDH subunit of lumenal location 3, chloroplastic-like isoform X2 [Miscanthus floridulus]
MDHEMEQKGCLCRIKNCAIELFSVMEEDLEVDDEDSWDLVGRDLRLKATFLYIDISRVIASCKGEEHKKALTVLANKFFYSMGELGDAVESRSLPLTQVRYSDTADALREVVAVLAPSLLQFGPHDPEE